MKFSLFTVAAMAVSAIAAPALSGLPNLGKDLKIGDISKELQLGKLPVIGSLKELASAIEKKKKGLPLPVGPSGHLLADLGPDLNNILVVTGPKVGALLIELSPEVAALLTSLGLPFLGAPLGTVVASASSLGALVTALGPGVDNLVTVVGADVGALLVSLSPVVAGLVSGLGLPGVGVPLGTVVATLGVDIAKRDTPDIPSPPSAGRIVGGLAPKLADTLLIIGPDSRHLLLQLSPEVAALVSGLGLASVGVPLGRVIATGAKSVGKLIDDLAKPVPNIVRITSANGSPMLIRLSPEVAALVAGLGLPGPGVSIGAIVATVGSNF